MNHHFLDQAVLPSSSSEQFGSRVSKLGPCQRGHRMVHTVYDVDAGTAWLIRTRLIDGLNCARHCLINTRTCTRETANILAKPSSLSQKCQRRAVKENSKSRKMSQSQVQRYQGSSSCTRHLRDNLSNILALVMIVEHSDHIISPGSLEPPSPMRKTFVHFMRKGEAAARIRSVILKPWRGSARRT